MQRSIQGLGGGQVAAKRLFDDDSRTVMTVRTGQPFSHGREELRRDREVIQRATRSAQRGSQLPERLWVAVVAVHILQMRRQRRKRARIHAAVFLEALVRAGLERVEVHLRLRHPDDRYLEITAPDQRLKGRKDLPVRQVAGRAEEHECVRLEIRHFSHRCFARTCVDAVST